MVKHGTQRKRRYGVKVTRRGAKNKNLKIKNAVTDPIVKSKWNSKISPRENFAALGLEPDPNSHKSSEHKTGKDAAFLGFATLPETPNPDHNPKRNPMSEDDQRYIVKCVKKYGEDFRKIPFSLMGMNGCKIPL